MDKYQRRMLRKWDEQRGKEQDSCDRYMKKYTLVSERKILKEAMQTYTPCPTDFVGILHGIPSHGFIRDFLLESLDTPFWFTRDQHPAVHRLGTPWWEFVWDKDMIGIPTKVNMEKTIEQHKHHADMTFLRDHAYSFYRTTGRTAYLSADLSAGAEKMQAILRCHAIKEELYQNVYHPRRIEKLLEQGGWDALENFAGL